MVQNLFENLTVLSVEQAVSLPYCTWRLALDGARVIRVEPLWGDPNRKVGKNILNEEGMCAYFFSVNCGKKAISLNLGSGKGKQILGEIIKKFDVDLFTCNQIPKNYEKLGIDYKHLSSIKDDIIWVGVSGFGPERSEAAYDPMIQAYSGIMDTNGFPGSDPLKFGISIADLEAANQAYSEIMKALYIKEKTGKGSRIDISMLDCCMSLLSLHLPMEDLEVPMRKSGNAHSTFAPVGVFKTKNGYVSIAIGNDAQWKAMTQLKGFESLNQTIFELNNNRKENEEILKNKINEILMNMENSEIINIFKTMKIPISEVNSIEDVLKNPYLNPKLLNVYDPKTGLKLKLAPPPVKSGDYSNLLFAPRFGEHNEEIYGKLGYNLNELKQKQII